MAVVSSEVVMRIEIAGTANQVADVLKKLALKGEVESVELEETEDETAPAAPARKRGRPTKEEVAARKAAEEAAAEEEDSEDESGEEEGEEDSEDESGEDEGEEEPEEEEKPVKKATKSKGPTSSDVIAAFQAYAKKYDRVKAKAILTKFKVQTVRDLPEEKWAAALKLLKV